MNKVEIIQNWIDKIKESNSLVNPVIDALQCEPENPISDSVYLIQTAYTEAVKQLIGDDKEWLDWFWWDNEMGLCGFEAGIGNNLRPIKTAEDLVWLLEQSGTQMNIITQEEMVMVTEAIRKETLEECIGICDEVSRQYGQYTFTARIVAETIKEIINET